MGLHGKSASIMTQKTTSGVGTAINVQKYERVVLTIIGEGTITAALEILGTQETGLTDPITDWTTPNLTNPVSPVFCVNQDSGSSVEGSTGIAFSGTAAVRQYILNTECLSWLNANLSAISGAGAKMTVKVRGVTLNYH